MKTEIGPVAPATAILPADLRRMKRAALDDVFRRSPPGPVPDGRARGTAIVFPGSWFDRLFQGFARLLIWRGKAFQTRDGAGTLKNLIGPFSNHLFEARVYTDESWFSDGKAVILDYSKSSFLVRSIRDEIRLVGERLYLGQVFWGRTRIALFMLEFPPVPGGSRAAAPGAPPDSSAGPSATRSPAGG